MTFGEIIEFYEGKEEIYCVSCSFVSSGNHQKKGGYIYDAKKAREIALNQRDHFIKAYASDKNKADKFYYGRIKCPELLLWLAEAADVDRETIRKAGEEAVDIITKEERWARNKAGKAIRDIIPWDMIEKQISQST